MKRTRVRWPRVVAMALGAALCVNLVASRAGTGGSVRTASRTYVVKPGDTIWSIARRQADSREDPRPLVDRLIRVNELRDAQIWPGQQLVIPA
ncbi:MAG TPA: LysM peptidoglycan-binding domain-containing protein [Actinomycetota bacterium]